MKQYLLSVYHPEGWIPEPAVMDKIMADVDALNIELQQAGAWVFAGGLHPSTHSDLGHRPSALDWFGWRSLGAP